MKFIVSTLAFVGLISAGGTGGYVTSSCSTCVEGSGVYGGEYAGVSGNQGLADGYRSFNPGYKGSSDENGASGSYKGHGKGSKIGGSSGRGKGSTTDFVESGGYNVSDDGRNGIIGWGGSQSSLSSSSTGSKLSQGLTEGSGNFNFDSNFGSQNIAARGGSSSSSLESSTNISPSSGNDWRINYRGKGGSSCSICQ